MLKQQNKVNKINKQQYKQTVVSNEPKPQIKKGFRTLE